MMPITVTKRSPRSRQPLGADPADLPCGYYLVREGASWRVVRWLPWHFEWRIGGGQTWPARHFDEIGRKVA